MEQHTFQTQQKLSKEKISGTYLQKKYSAEWTMNAKEIYHTTRDTEVNSKPISEDQGNSEEKENRRP